MARPLTLTPEQLAIVERIAAERRAARMIPTNDDLAAQFGCTFRIVQLAVTRANRRAAYERDRRARERAASERPPRGSAPPHRARDSARELQRGYNQLEPVHRDP